MKKVISICVVVFILLNSVATFAADQSIISYKTALQRTLENNWELKRIKYAEYQANQQYKDAQKFADEISINAIKEYYATIPDKSLDEYTEMQILKQRDLVPKQVQYNITQAQDQYKVTEKSLSNGLRGLYLNALSTDFTVQTNNKRLALAEKRYRQDKVKFQQGNISQLDIEQSEYNYLKAQQAVADSARRRENAIRNLNQFIGEPINRMYDKVVFDDGFDYKKLQRLDFYVEKALKERVDISDIEAQIQLKKLEMSIMEKNDVHKIYRAGRSEYSNLQSEVESLQLKLQQTRIDIEKNIKDAYIDIQKDLSTIKGLESTLESQKKLLNKMREQWKLGVLTESSIEDMEINIEEGEYNLLLAIYNCNTKYQQLENAAGYGPAY